MPAASITGGQGHGSVDEGGPGAAASDGTTSAEGPPAAAATHEPSHPFVRFLGAGGLGTVIGFAMYELIFALLPSGLEARAPTAWGIAYLVGIWVQHALHRTIVFGDASPYWRSLRRSYVIYSGALVLSTGLNWSFAIGLGWHHRLAWLVTTAVTTVVNYATLRLYAFARPASGPDASPTSPDEPGP